MPIIIMDGTEGMPDPDDCGCDYCRNDGKLNENNACPKCDAQYDVEDDSITPAAPPREACTCRLAPAKP